MATNKMYNTKIEVLISEDNPAELRLLKIAMNLAGLTPLLNLTFTFDGEEAIRELKKSVTKSAFNLVLLDLNMPLTPGKSVLEFLKKEQITFPLVIVLSNSDHQKDIEDCFKLGAHAYLTKPSNFEELENFCTVLRTCIEQHGSLSIEFIRTQFPALRVPIAHTVVSTFQSLK